MIHAGTYSVPIAPANSGSSGNPIVYMNYQSGVCSLYTSTCPIKIDGVDYVIVQGIRAQLALTANGEHVSLINNSQHSAILNCYFYGGTTSDLADRGVFTAFMIDSSSYCRFMGNYCDRQDPNLDNDGSWLKEDRRGDGIAIWSGDAASNMSHYNIIEGNTVVNVSHYGIVPAYGIGSNDGFNIVRNNTVYNSHVGIGTMNTNVRNMVEANRVYSIGQRNQHRGGVAWEGTGQKTIVRFNMFYDDSTAPTNGSLYSANGTGTQASYALDIDNRYYGNVFMGKSSNTYQWHSFVSELGSGLSAYDFGRSVFVNNIFGPTITTYQSIPYYWKDADDSGADRDTLRYNAFWTGTPGDTVAAYEHGSVYWYPLSGAKAAEATFEASNIEVSPLWVDSLTLRGSRSFTLSATSLCIDAGGPLTEVVGTVSNSTVVPVKDASYFHYDWGGSPYDGGDSVLIGTDRRKIDSIDYVANNLILTSAVTATDGDDVGVLATYSSQTGLYTNRLSGSAPDIGPYEYPSGGSVTAPDTVHVVSPAYGSTQLQPTTLHWNTVLEATQYGVCMTVDNWSTAVVNVSGITDTFYTVGGLPADTTVLWNVRAGNSAGWSAWNSDWKYYTAEAGAVTDSTVVNWTQRTTTKTMADDTRVVMQNVQMVTTFLVLRNPSRYSVTWPSGVIWPGFTSPPALTDTLGVYMFVRDSTRVYGIVLTNKADGK